MMNVGEPGRTPSEARGVIDRYRDLLPVGPDTPIITLGEGGTPLVPAPYLSEMTGAEVLLKMEGANPTGSFKDRGMTVAVSKAVEEGMRAAVCASTGNTAASAAAYCARAGMRCAVVVPKGSVARGKLAQALLHGAAVVEVEAGFDRALELVRETAARYPVALVNSVNPYRIEGQKTAAFEIVDELGDVPDCLAIPVGNAGNITAYWKGFRQYASEGRGDRTPRMLGFQAAGAAPIVLGRPVEEPETAATAIKIGNPASWEGAVAAVRESGGFVDAVSDEEILDAYRILAGREGVFAEPASAASVAGVLKSARDGRLPPGARIACVLTGHGLKDPDRAVDSAGFSPRTVPPDVDAVAREVVGRG